jgi:hypothetical protein
LKYLPEAKPEDMLCKQCKNTNSITHLIALCNHIKPLWQDLATLYGEITAIIPDEFKYSIKEEYFYFGPPTMPSRRQNLEKVQFPNLRYTDWKSSKITTKQVETAILQTHSLIQTT